MTPMQKTAFLRFINLKSKFCYWGNLPPDPHHGSAPGPSPGTLVPYTP